MLGEFKHVKQIRLNFIAEKSILSCGISVNRMRLTHLITYKM